MGIWSKLALIAAGALAGSVATRAAARAQPPGPAPGGGVPVRRRPATPLTRPATAPQHLRALARRFGYFAARVKAGMDEREAQLREQFGVRDPVDHTAGPPPGHIDQRVVDPTAPATEISNHVRSSEGNNR